MSSEQPSDGKANWLDDIISAATTKQDDDPLSQNTSVRVRLAAALLDREMCEAAKRLKNKGVSISVKRFRYEIVEFSSDGRRVEVQHSIEWDCLRWILRPRDSDAEKWTPQADSIEGIQAEVQALAKKLLAYLMRVEEVSSPKTLD